MLKHFVCTNCGFWQLHHSPPRGCPVCEDVRHTPPTDGYRFLEPAAVGTEFGCTWEEIIPDVWAFRAEPSIGIGPCGYLLRRAGGNIAFEVTGWYTPAALDHIAHLGGISMLAASHPHAYGALWQLQERFAPEVVVHVADLTWTSAFRVTYPCDERLELAPGVTLLHTGGHFPGHTVLHDATRHALFAGDTLKFHLDEEPPGISCHKAFNRQIPLSHAEVRRYREVFAPLDFSQTFTTFEHAPAGDRAAALRLFDQHLAGQPFCTPIPLEG